MRIAFSERFSTSIILRISSRVISDFPVIRLDHVDGVISALDKNSFIDNPVLFIAAFSSKMFTVTPLSLVVGFVSFIATLSIITFIFYVNHFWKLFNKIGKLFTFMGKKLLK